MFNLVDQLYVGTLDVDRVNLNFNHFKQRLAENRFSLDFVKNLLFNEEMLDYTSSEEYENGYKLFYQAPDSKEYGKITICVRIFNGCINVMTIYADNYTSSKSRRNSSKPKSILKNEKLERNSKRNYRY